MVLAALAAVGVGCLLARFTGRSRLYTASRQLLFSMVPAAITYAIGTAVGVGLT